MAEPISIRVERPYTNEEDFLAAEAWSVTARSLLLIGVDPIPEGTTLRCELRLASGVALIVAEGIAVKHLDATTTRPAGLVVRYKRMSAASSDFIQRAVARTGKDRPPSQPDAASDPAASAFAKPGRKISSRPAGPRAASAPPPQPNRKGDAAGVRRVSARPPARPPSERPKSERPNAAPRDVTRRSDRPKSGRPSGRPSASTGRISVAPHGMNGHRDPEAPAARSVSVVPPAKRVSSLPPDARRADEAPKKSRATQPEQPAPGPRRSGAPVSGAATQPAVSGSEKRRDSSAMQRLRSRATAKAISTPPDREAILSRLKKKPQTP